MKDWIEFHCVGLFLKHYPLLPLPRTSLLPFCTGLSILIVSRHLTLAMSNIQFQVACISYAISLFHQRQFSFSSYFAPNHNWLIICAVIMCSLLSRKLSFLLGMLIKTKVPPHLSCFYFPPSFTLLPSSCYNTNVHNYTFVGLVQSLASETEPHTSSLLNPSSCHFGIWHRKGIRKEFLLFK